MDFDLASGSEMPVTWAVCSVRGKETVSMTTLFALGIVGLFVVWVRSLKTEVVMLQRQLFNAATASPSVSGSPRRMSAPLVRHVQSIPAGDAMVEEAAKEPIERKSRDTEGGIPTWTLG